MTCVQKLFSLTALIVPAAISLTLAAQPQTDSGGAQPIVVISDVHMGLGRRADGQWDPKGDFRWSSALRGFLDEIARRNNEQVDLVIAGDFLELWQPPAGIQCAGDGADLGCTTAEMREIVRRVIAAHKEDLAALGTFAKRGTNKVHIVPGNHDAALVIPEIWQLVANAMDGGSGRVVLVADGVFVSVDGHVLVEHGHQIGSDVNRYKDWPKVTAQKDGRDFMVRPWGELFVQRLFNAEEEKYPIIDNLSPETVGARYRMADRGLWRSTADIARFIAFNVFETSARQKGASLGRQADAAAPCTRAEAEALGHKLVIGTLPTSDPFRAQVEAKTPEAQRVRNDLDALVKKLPDEDIQHLCARQIDQSTLGAGIEARFVPRTAVIGKHLRERAAKHSNVRFFIYGHTHQIEEGWALQLDKERSVDVFNTGAFQRLIDEAGFLARVEGLKPKKNPEHGLRQIALEMLAPCYGVVLVNYKAGVPTAETTMWHMPEDGKGRYVSPGNKECE